jgi:hypothetical protein
VWEEREGEGEGEREGEGEGERERERTKRAKAVMTWYCFCCVRVWGRLMMWKSKLHLWAHTHTTGKKETDLHAAAERGESERLQRLLDAGSDHVNQKNEDSFDVCEERILCAKREREKKGV